MEEKSTKKAAKKLIKLAKKHPDWYTQEDVMRDRRTGSTRQQL